ncbi:glucosamine-6-phosphate deaminase [Enterococcus sp. HY326]|uniref:glucosamine-6-phosphate deaminase n=1 Tax=Enterococcus sp. HY326 TaxID=2971265 RepID=UPI00223EC2E3|nr:glucosamine-6-phosphate deaminase [Enterococcus sp. HY326]
MRILKTKNLAEFNQLGANLLLTEMLKSHYRVNLAITAGRTPKGIYDVLIEQVKDKTYLDNVFYYNFDEIPYQQSDREGITISDLRSMYLRPANVAEKNIQKMDMTNFNTQDERILQAGGLDAILLGVGADGHYCGNLPGTTKFEDLTTEVVCDEKMKQRISRLFETKEEVPDSYITMGPRSIMAAHHLILSACGTEKAEIIKAFVEGPVTIDLPVTLLKTHPNLTLLVDDEAGSLI